MEKSNAPYAFLVKRQTFAPYKLKKRPAPEEYVQLFELCSCNYLQIQAKRISSSFKDPKYEIFFWMF